MLLVYCEHITNRVQYSFNLLLKELLGINYQFTTDKAHFCEIEDARINYSDQPLEDELYFSASPLLFNRFVKQQEIEVFNYRNTKAFFKVADGSAMPFDIFAATFYLVSRYEEYYDDVERDEHDRYPAKASLAYQHDFLHQPVINIWANELGELLKDRFPELQLTESTYKFIPTYDIDIAYSMKNKGLLRNGFGILRALRHLRFDLIMQRFRVWMDRETDPYDTYAFLKKLHDEYKLDPIFFFLVGDYGAYDKNISIDNIQMQDLIQSTGDYADLGIHPSYESNSDIAILDREVKSLAAVSKKDVNRSRQHFLMLKMPDTYQRLTELDIKKDYTMGYASEIGFRAGIASSFWFYDLNLELPVKLRIYPFAAMDVTLKNYLGYTPEQALEKMKLIIQETKAAKGLFTTIWHNSSLSETDSWEGWKDFYVQLVKEATQS